MTSPNRDPFRYMGHWGQVADETELPNVAGAAIQRVTVAEGDTCYALAGNRGLYRCDDATPGAAAWVKLDGIPAGETVLTDALRWDDLRSPATAINPPGAVQDPDRDATTGLLLFDDSLTEIVAITAQMPHAWAEGTAIRPHVHWKQTGIGNVLWRLEYKVYNVGALVPAVYATLESATGDVVYPGAGTISQVTSLGFVDMTGFRDSAQIEARLSRVGGDPLDTMIGDAALIEFDIHYQSDGLGSVAEFPGA